MGDSEGVDPGVHAEHNALLKLKSSQNKKRLDPINLLVVRFKIQELESKDEITK